LTQLDGGTFTPTFTDLQGVTGVTAGTGLTGGTITTTGTVAVDFTTVAPLASPTFTGTVGGITKSMVGLGNVDNTTDVNKPISSATQTALNLKFNTADTTSLNLTSRFAAKQNILNGTGFVKASGTNITFDNSSYLRTGLADSTYLKLTGGTLTGALNGTTGTFTTRLGVGSIGASSVPTLFTSGSGDQEVHFTHNDNIQGRKVSLRLTNNNSGFYTFGGLIYALQGEGLNQYNRMTLGINTTEVLHLTRFSRVGIMNNSPSYTLDVNGTFNASGNSLIGGTLGVTGAATLSSTLAVTGNITEGGNNVLTNLDTASLSTRIDAKLSGTDTTFLSDRINLKYNSSGGTISGAVTLSTTTATPTSLLGKDGSNVVGAVTTVAQTGLFGRGSVSNEVTDANGNITVAHGFNFTPIMAFANLPGQTTNIINVKSVDATNIVFVVRDGATNNVLNTQTVTKIEFFAIK